MSLERIVRKLLVPKGDVNAAQRGRIARRVGRRIYGKATGRLAASCSAGQHPGSRPLGVRVGGGVAW